MLCTRCQSTLTDIDEGKITGPHYGNSKDLIAASNAHCYICATIVRVERRLRPSTGLSENIDLQWMYAHEQTYKTPSMHNIKFRYSDIYTAFPSEHIFRLELNEPVSGFLEAGRDIYGTASSTADTLVHKLAQHWLENCIKTHTECGRKCDAKFRPPRLLDVHKDPPVLVQTELLPNAVEYATLSHCWGPNPTFKTLTADGYDNALRNGLPITELPATFRQSINFCRNIGIVYLWIDSLCIMQSGSTSEADWLHHVSVMPDIYANGKVNIAAEWAQSSENGMFVHRDPASVVTPQYTFCSPVLQGTRQIVSHSGEDERDLDSSASLNSRGWVAQERLLSPRIVRFGDDQIRWECSQSRNESERFPYGTESTRDILRFPVRIEPKNTRIHKISGRLGIDRAKYNVEPRESYRSLVMEFSKRNFTRPDSDKLAAFGAIAKHFSSILKGRYVAGLYESNLPHALAWVVKTPQKQRPVRSMYRAPSWSWASMDAPVTMEKFVAKRSPPLRLFNINLRDPHNEYGPLLSAEIIIYVHLLPCTWTFERTSKNTVVIKTMKYLLSDGEQQQIEKHLEGGFLYFDYHDDICGDQNDIRLCPIDFDQANKSAIKSSEYQFLILRRVRSREVGDMEVYERIGASQFGDFTSFYHVFRYLYRMKMGLIRLV